MEERADLGLMGPEEQWPLSLQEKRGRVRTPIAQEAWEAQEEDRAIRQYVALTGLDLETARLDLDNLKFEHMKDAEQFDRMGVPERLKQQWAFEWALEEFREKGRDKRAAMSAAGRGGGGDDLPPWLKAPTAAGVGTATRRLGDYFGLFDKNAGQRHELAQLPLIRTEAK